MSGCSSHHRWFSQTRFGPPPGSTSQVPIGKKPMPPADSTYTVSPDTEPPSHTLPVSLTTKLLRTLLFSSYELHGVVFSSSTRYITRSESSPWDFRFSFLRTRSERR